MDSDLEGKKLFLRVGAKVWPELSLTCELSHSLPALKKLPQHSSVRVRARAGDQRYETEAVVQVEGCAVHSRGLVESQRGLRGSLLYLNNCSVIQVSDLTVLMASAAPFLSDLVMLCVRSGAALTV